MSRRKGVFFSRAGSARMGKGAQNAMLKLTSAINNEIVKGNPPVSSEEHAKLIAEKLKLLEGEDAKVMVRWSVGKKRVVFTPKQKS